MQPDTTVLYCMRSVSYTHLDVYKRQLHNNPDAVALRLVACHSVKDAVRGADIVTTITADKTNATILTPDMLAPGMHINGVGGDCPGKTEVHADVLRAAKVFVEYEPQTRIEGDLQQMEADFGVTELWQVLSGQLTGRDNDAQITMFGSVGFAMEDFSSLRYVHDPVSYTHLDVYKREPDTV